MSAKLTATLCACAASVIAYTVSNVAQIYWLSSSSLSLMGQFIFFLAAIIIMSCALLALHAARTRDWSIVLPDSDVRERRLFCCTLCAPRARAAGARLLDDDGDSADALLDAGADATDGTSDALPAFRWTFATTTQTELLFLMGLANAVASLLQWYCTPPTREPPLLNSVIPCLAVVCSVPISKWLLRDPKSYAAPAPVAAFAAIVCGLVVSLLPALLAGGGLGGAESARDLFLWTLINVASQVPSGGALVLTQAYLLRADAADAAAAAAGAGDANARATRKLTAVLRFVAYNQCGVGVGAATLWWLDILPWFGSEGLSEFFAGVRFAFVCSLGFGAGGPDCATTTPLWALLGVAPYAVYLGSIAVVASDSAVFGNIVLVVQTCLQSAFFLIPGTNPDAAATPVWSTLVSVALGLGGVVLFKVWEEAQGVEIVVPDSPTRKAAAEVRLQ